MIALSWFLVVAVVSGLIGLLVYRLRRKRRLSGLAVLGVLLLPLVLVAVAAIPLTRSVMVGGIVVDSNSSVTVETYSPMMDRWGVWLALLGAAVVLILGIFWLRRDLRALSLFAFFGTVVLAVLAVAGAAAGFNSLLHIFPVTDDPKLRDSNQLKVIFIEPANAGHLLFVHHDQLAMGEDFEILAEVSTSSSKRPADPHRFEIQAPKSLELRTPNRCERPAAPEDGHHACASVSNGGSFRVKWDATPTATGSARLRLVLPEALRPAVAIGPNWRAVVALNDLIVTERGTLKGPYSWTAAQIPAAELSAMKPTLSLSDYDCSLDLQFGEIACVTQILRTVGVDESTYATLGIVGTVLAGGLGSGWLVQFLAWVWRKIRPRPKGASAKVEGTSSDL